MTTTVVHNPLDGNNYVFEDEMLLHITLVEGVLSRFFTCLASQPEDNKRYSEHFLEGNGRSLHDFDAFPWMTDPAINWAGPSQLLSDLHYGDFQDYDDHVARLVDSLEQLRHPILPGIRVIESHLDYSAFKELNGSISLNPEVEVKEIL